MDANPGLESQQHLLTAKQAAAFLGISSRKLWELTAKHEIPHLRIGRCLRYSLEGLRQWVATNTSRCGSDKDPR
jgi:excisionase family DNA binding protein